MRFGKNWQGGSRRFEKWDKENTRLEKITKWHLWFAWYPVYMNDGTFVWLEDVYRKRHLHFEELYVTETYDICIKDFGWWDYKE